MAVVAIDAGHGSNTPGKRTPDNYLEHWINVKTAYYCEQYLKMHGIQTMRIAWNDTNAKDDQDVPLATRQKIIKAAKCDYSISFHANAYGNGRVYNSAQGVVTLISNKPAYQKDSMNFAKKVHARLLEGTKQHDYGVRTQSLAMCNCVAMGVKAACLVEIGFMTNEHEAELLKTDVFCKEQGEDAAQGILDYLKVPVKKIDTSTVIKVNVAQFVPKHGDLADFNKIIVNLKQAINNVFKLSLPLNSITDDTLLIHLGNIALAEGNPYTDLNYVLQQLLKWWGYSISIDGIYGKGTASTVATFQSQVNIPVTRTTTAEFWRKLIVRSY